MITFFNRYATWRNTIILLLAQFAVQATILFMITPKQPTERRGDRGHDEVKNYVFEAALEQFINLHFSIYNFQFCFMRARRKT